MGLHWYVYELKQHPDLYEIVQIHHFKPEKFQQQLIVHGELTAHKFQRILFDLQKNVEHLLIRNGDKVKSGQVLALIGSRIERQVALKIFNKNKFLMQKLVGKMEHKYSSSKDYLENTDILNTIFINNKSIDHIIKQLIVTATIDGTVTNLILEKDQPTPMNKIGLEIINDETLILKAQISEKYLNDTKNFEEAWVFIPNDLIIKSKIISIDRSINPILGTFEVKIHIPNKEQHLWHGLYTKAILKGAPIEAYCIPNSAIIKNENNEYLITYIDKNYVVHKQKVKILQKDLIKNNTWIELYSKQSDDPNTNNGLDIITFGGQFFQDKENINKNRIVKINK